MWRCFALVVFATALQTACPITRAQAQSGGMPCDSFVKNPDGSWTATQDAYIPGPNIKAREGGIFRPGRVILGMDVAAKLDEACPKQAVAPPPSQSPAPAAAAQAQEPQVPLSRYADANGNIDVQRLTCANLAATSTEEADLLLAWYSGRFNGLAKGRGINLAQMRYAIRNVDDYCKVNRDKRLLQVMDLMLK